MLNYIYSFSLCCFLILFNQQSVNAQCSATIEDTLFMSSGLQLAGVPTSGTPPFSYNWTINGSLNGPINPTTTNATGDTILIGINDLFSNYGCIYISLCITDANGCTNCQLDTAFTEAIICFSGFISDTLQPGVSMLSLPNPAPSVVGISIATWEQDGQQQSAPILNGVGIINYNPATYNPAGYKIPVCVQTLFFDTPNVSCFFCDSVYIRPTAPSSIDEQDMSLSYRLNYNPISNELRIQWSGNQQTYVAFFDLNGRLLLLDETTAGIISLNTSGLASGTYLLQIRQNGFTKTQKVIKQ